MTCLVWDSHLKLIPVSMIMYIFLKVLYNSARAQTFKKSHGNSLRPKRTLPASTIDYFESSSNIYICVRWSRWTLGPAHLASFVGSCTFWHFSTESGYRYHRYDTSTGISNTGAENPVDSNEVTFQQLWYSGRWPSCMPLVGPDCNLHDLGPKFGVLSRFRTVLHL